MFVESLQELIFVIWTLICGYSFKTMDTEQKNSTVSLLLQALIEMRAMGQPMSTQDTENLARAMCNHYANRVGDQFTEIDLDELNWAEAPECLRSFYLDNLPEVFSCDRCKQEIPEVRYACFNVENFDLCKDCFHDFQRGDTDIPSNYVFLLTTETEFNWEEPVPGKCPRKANMIAEKTNGYIEEEEFAEADQTKIDRLLLEIEQKDQIIEEQEREIKRLKAEIGLHQGEASSCFILPAVKDYAIIGEMGVFDCMTSPCKK